MFQTIINLFCEVVIAAAAVKYLMPDIRKICRIIADTHEKEEISIENNTETK